MNFEFNYIVEENSENVKLTLGELLENSFKPFGESLVNSVMLEERSEYIGCKSYERSQKRKTISSGFHDKTVSTKYGDIVLRIPETRDGRFFPKIMTKYSRKELTLEKLIKSLLVRGLSTRKTSSFLKKHLGVILSSAGVSNVIKSFDEEINYFHEKVIADEYIFLYCDGLYKTAKGFKRNNKRVVLAVYGVKKDLSKEIIDFIVVGGETENNWYKLLNSIYKRGLKGDNLKLIMHDANNGLMNAINFVYGSVPTQYCIYHKMQNSARKITKTENRKPFLNDLSYIYKHSKTPETFHRLLRQFTNDWIGKEEDAVLNFKNKVFKTLTYLKFEEKYKQFITTNNRIERFFKEIRRRTKLIEGFENDNSIERFFYHITKENDYIKGE